MITKYELFSSSVATLSRDIQTIERMEMAKFLKCLVVIIWIWEAFVQLMAQQIKFTPQVVEILLRDKEFTIDPIVDKCCVKCLELRSCELAQAFI